MDQGLNLTIRELTRNPRFRRHVLGVGVAVAVFSYLGPFGTSGRLTAVELVIYWTLAIVPNWALAVIVFPYSLGDRFRTLRGYLPAAAVATLACAVPGTGLILALEAWMAEPIESARSVAYVYSCVVLVFFVLAFLSYRLLEDPYRAPEPSGPGASAAISDALPGGEPHAHPEFLSRLPSHLGKEILHLRMQDHYVEVHTDRGKDMVLLRFRDAMRELDGADGRQVHRSHWVARRAVTGTMRKGGRLFLKLSNDSIVPVSRTFMRDLKGEGWL